jgi:hypothetical protein
VPALINLAIFAYLCLHLSRANTQIDNLRLQVVQERGATIQRAWMVGQVLHDLNECRCQTPEKRCLENDDYGYCDYCGEY